MCQRMKTYLSFAAAGVLGASAAFAVFEAPRMWKALSDPDSLDLKLVLLASFLILLSVSTFVFKRGRRNASLFSAALAALLLYAMVFNVKSIKFMACDYLLAGKHRHIDHDGEAHATPEQRCTKLVYN